MHRARRVARQPRPARPWPQPARVGGGKHSPGRPQGRLFPALRGPSRRCGDPRTPGRSRPCRACARRSTRASCRLEPAADRLGALVGDGAPASPDATRRNQLHGAPHPLGHGRLLGVVSLRRGGGVHLLLASLLARLVRWPHLSGGAAHAAAPRAANPAAVQRARLVGAAGRTREGKAGRVDFRRGRYGDRTAQEAPRGKALGCDPVPMNFVLCYAQPIPARGSVVACGTSLHALWCEVTHVCRPMAAILYSVRKSLHTSVLSTPNARSVCSTSLANAPRWP